MGLYKASNDLTLRLNGKNGAEARMAAGAIAEALDGPLTALVTQAEYQSKMLFEIVQRLEALETKP